MDPHEDDISILPDTEEDQTTIDIDGSGLSPFRLNSVDIPASTHALQTAYRDLKNRYNESEQRLRSLRRQTRESSVQRMASENSFLSGENFPPFGAGAGEQGAAAMADQSADDQAKQGLINHLTRQLIVTQKNFSIYEDELNRTKQTLDDLREKYEKSLHERDRMGIKCRELEEYKVRNSQEVAEFKEIIRKLKGEVNRLEKAVSSKDQKVHNLQQQFEHLKLPLKSTPDITREYPSSFPGQKGSGVVSLTEFQQVKEQMKKSQENMRTLRQVVLQQNDLIKSLQGEKSSKDSRELESCFTSSADLLGQSERSNSRQFIHRIAKLSDSTKDIFQRDSSKFAQLCADQVPSLSKKFTFEPVAVEVADCVRPRAGNSNVMGSPEDGFTGDSLLHDVGKVSGSVQDTRVTSPRENFASVVDTTDKFIQLPIQDSYTESNRVVDTGESTHGMRARYMYASPDPYDVPGNLSRLHVNLPRPQPTESSTLNTEANQPDLDHMFTNSAGPSAAKRDCPVCGVDYSCLSMADFQNHVFDCYDNTESGEIHQGQTAPWNVEGSAMDSRLRTSQREDSSSQRICPVCQADFAKDIPQDIYERHVYEHFGEPPNIVDDFAILNP